MKTYPRIGRTTKIPALVTKGRGRCRCGKGADYRIDIEVSYFRGDDEVVKSCEDHKKNINYLLGGK